MRTFLAIKRLQVTKNRKVTKPERSQKKELHNAHVAANSFTPIRVRAETKIPAPYIL